MHIIIELVLEMLSNRGVRGSVWFGLGLNSKPNHISRFENFTNQTKPWTLRNQTKPNHGLRFGSVSNHGL